MLGFLKRLWAADAAQAASDIADSRAPDVPLDSMITELVDRYFEQRVAPLQMRVLHVLERRLTAIGAPPPDRPDATPATAAECEIEFMLGYWDEQRPRLERELTDLLARRRGVADQSSWSDAVAGPLEVRFASVRQELAHKGQKAAGAALMRVADAQDAA